ncbi:hypothetical protein KB206_19985 [Microvirga sp. STS02]|uniref:hypothetical protein n=1 Tax=Hymenobacter negativus TaxID=2795026 RepID=UPI0018DDC50F|nr:MULTISPECIES: hypothetical protein [Bacteria]MBH8571186.1 hypothetical protein [Hymenobacter negativus]MBR7210923.1 hypothetical protein [Microvirga sp. STS02]
MRQLLKYKEFWFALVLITLIALFALGVKTYDSYGNYWVETLKGKVISHGLSDGQIYSAFTRKAFTEFTIWIIWLVFFLFLEIRFLVTRRESGIALRMPILFFVIAVAPFLFNAFRAAPGLYHRFHATIK